MTREQETRQSTLRFGVFGPDRDQGDDWGNQIVWDLRTLAVAEARDEACTHAPARDGKACALYSAPTLWCASCRPMLAAEKGIDVTDWPDWRYKR